MTVPEDYTPAVLITGSNRGIGLGLARKYAERNYNLIATCRNPGEASQLKEIAARHTNVRIEQLDVLDHQRINQLAEQYAELPIDILINNAGISGGFENQFFGGIRYEYYADVLATNFIAPLKMAEAFIKNVASSNQKKIISISSMQSSIGLSFGRQYIDRPSKASLNMVMRTLSKDVASLGVTVGLIAPGLVDTALTKGLDVPKISVEESADAVIGIIDRFTLAMSGSLIAHTGDQLPW